MTERKRYRFLTGPDDADFCQRVSDALTEGYVLFGNPVMVSCESGITCGQAVVLPDTKIAAATIPSPSNLETKSK